MSYAAADAEMSSAREILFHCSGQLATQIRQKKSRSQPDAQRLADLELVLDQPLDEIDAVTSALLGKTYLMLMP